MQLEAVPEFSGTQEDTIQPTEFLKTVKRSFLQAGIQADDQKINNFELFLKSDSPAEEWYTATGSTKTKWVDLEKAFKTRFPNITKATKTRAELERELGELRIATEDLGKTEKYMGEDVYTHVIFAKKILDIAAWAKIETTTSGLYTLRDKLPEVLREKVPENQKDWTTLCQALEGVEMSHIWEGVRKYNEKAASEARFQAELDSLKRRTANPPTNVFNSPTKAIREQLHQTMITQPTVNHTATNPFTSNTGGQGNLFSVPTARSSGTFPSTSARPQRAPVTDDEIKALKASIARYPIQPDTPDGLASYHEQLRTWKQTNGTYQPSKLTGFPLRPGGAPPGSNECYGCGKTGHLGRECVETNKLPAFEGKFRSICGSILRRPPAQVNHVSAEVDEFAWANTSTSTYQQSGNGEGPPAY